MKMKNLLSLIAFIGAFQMAISQTTIDVVGQLTNTKGAAITLGVTLYDGTYHNSTATTDAAGYYNTTFQNVGTSGTVYIAGTDCKNDSIYTVLQYTVLDSFVIAPTFDYCPGANCMAYFSIDQAYINGGATAVPGTLVVTDSSTGGTAMSPLSYSWSFGDGSNGTGTQLTHAYSGNGPYVLCLTISDTVSGCSDTFCDTISVDSSGMIIESLGFNLIIGSHSLGVNENKFESTFKLYPNPATEFINIEFNNTNQNINSINLIDVSGKLIYSQNIDVRNGVNKIKIDANNLDKGIYIIQLTSDSQVFNKKAMLK